LTALGYGFNHSDFFLGEHFLTTYIAHKNNMNRLALAAIKLYQRYVSPFKGFSCAYRVQTGRASCSTHGYRVVERYGTLLGLKLIKRRLNKCGQKYREHINANKPGANAPTHRRRQAGFCDAGCDIGHCDVGDLGSCACDALSGCDSFPCDLDFGNWKRRKKNDLKYVDIAPNSMPE
jgi:putative component of membrane protein insertase Oxa1/YidC/SpoIIIJ protein YidD